MDETPRLVSGVTVSALIRTIEAAGGGGMVIAKGDATAGALLLLLADRGESTALLERTLGLTGYGWNDSGPAAPSERPAYLERRRKSDPDLWIVELDHPNARAIALEMLG